MKYPRVPKPRFPLTWIQCPPLRSVTSGLHGHSRGISYVSIGVEVGVGTGVKVGGIVLVAVCARDVGSNTLGQLVDGDIIVTVVVGMPAHVQFGSP